LQSKALDGRRVYRMTVPNNADGIRLPLLILLHGVEGAETDWIDRGGLVETLNGLSAEGKIGPMAVLTPSDGLAGIGSGYLNWAQGPIHRYEDYVMEDLLLEAEQRWSCGGRREKRAIAGLSMGGFAAFRLGLKFPHLFGSASSLSGFFDAAELERLIGTRNYLLMFRSSQRRVRKNSPLHMDMPSGFTPRLCFDCGVSDPYIEQNRAFRQRLQELGITHQYAEHEGGHSWEYWHKHLADHLLFHDDAFRRD
jgi:putative tributyrin esterase